ncbi:MAG: putative Ig domain-containing protein [Aureliella sp.]
MTVLAGWPVVGDRGYDDLTLNVEFGEPIDGNAQPVIAAIPNQTIDELTELTIQLTAADPDSAPGDLTWSKTSGPAGLQVNSQTGLLTWTSAPIQLSRRCRPGNL